MIYNLVIFLHILVSLTIIVLVLLQQGKGGDIGAAFGSRGASSTLFGSQGTSGFLYKFTGLMMLVFCITSLSLTYFIGHPAKKVDPLLQMPDVESKHEQPNTDVPVVDLPKNS